jgi:hypothetical protein
MYSVSLQELFGTKLERSGFKMRKDNLIKTVEDDYGIQHLYDFKNGYGASVIKSRGSYGGRQGLWELAVMTVNGEHMDLCYSTYITEDVLGHLSIEQVNETLEQISKLVS